MSYALALAVRHALLRPSLTHGFCGSFTPGMCRERISSRASGEKKSPMRESASPALSHVRFFEKKRPLVETGNGR